MISENDDQYLTQYVASKNKYKAFDTWLKANGSSAQSVLSGNMPQTGGATLMQGTYCVFYNREVLRNNLAEMKDKNPKLSTYDCLNDPATGGGIFDTIKSKAASAVKSATTAVTSGITRIESGIKGKDFKAFPSVTQLKGLVGSNARIVKNGEKEARSLFRVGALLKIFKFIETTAKPLYNSIIKVLVKISGKSESAIKEKLSGKIPDDILDVQLTVPLNFSNPNDITDIDLQDAADTINAQLGKNGQPLVDAVFIVTINRMSTNQFHKQIGLRSVPALTSQQLALQPKALATEVVSVDSTTLAQGAQTIESQTGGALFVVAEAEYDKLEASTPKGGFVQFKYEQTGGDDGDDFLGKAFYYIFVYPFIQVFHAIIVDSIVNPIVKATTGVTHSMGDIASATSSSVDASSGLVPGLGASTRTKHTPSKGGMRTISLNRNIGL